MLFCKIEFVQEVFMHIGSRLETIGRLVPQGAVVADVGTDHAYLPVWLIEQGRIERAIAGDIAAGPCQAARSTVAQHGLQKSVEVRQGSGLSVLKPGGRLSVITYHSLEDRIVKNMMKAGNPEGKIEQDFFGRIETPFKLVNNKVIIPDADEQERNPRSRSAKLRIAEKK